MAVEALAPCGDCNNSIQFFIYLRADSTAIGLLQSQHGHNRNSGHHKNNVQKQHKKNKNKWPVQASTKYVHNI
jgi:hypothetical protein